jgi:hypothetical protein
MEILEKLLTSDIGKEKPDVLSLYFLYAKTADPDEYGRQLSDIKVDGAAEVLEISPHRIRKAKKVLFEYGLIQQVSMKNEENIIHHYIEVL